MYWCVGGIRGRCLLARSVQAASRVLARVRIASRIRDALSVGDLALCGVVERFHLLLVEAGKQKEREREAREGA